MCLKNSVLIVCGWLAALTTAGETGVFYKFDPKAMLTVVLEDFNASGRKPRNADTAGSVRIMSRSEGGYGEIRFSDDELDDRLELQKAFKPNEFPFIRMRTSFDGDPPEKMAAAPFPVSASTARPIQIGNASGKEYQVRLAPDLIESKEPYSNEGLALCVQQGSMRHIAVMDYVMADAVPTLGLCEWDSQDAPGAQVLKAEKTQISSERSMLGILAKKNETEIRITEPNLQAGEYNALELCLSRPDGVNGPLRIQFENEDGEQGSVTLDDWPADGEMHRCLIYLYKCPQWRGRIRQISVFPLQVDLRKPVIIFADYLRARFVPVPGAGCISSGFNEAGSMESVLEEWSESTKRIAKWRFVAGQSWGPGNRARMFRNFGQSFKNHRIAWETDVPSQRWLDCSDPKRRIVPKVNGRRSPEASARLAYNEMNQIGLFLDQKGMRLEAAHFDGVIRHLMCPQHLPGHQKGMLGGFYEQFDGNLEKCYEATATALCEFFVLCRTEPDSTLENTVFYVQPNFHCWSWEYGPLKCRQIFGTQFKAGNFREAIDILCRMDKEYEKAGRYGAGRLSPLEGFGADWVFINLKGPARLQLNSYEWYVTQVLGYKFCVANNGFLKDETPQERSENTLESARLFLERGGRPHSFTPYYWMKPWNDAPLHGSGGEALLPETEPHTFMNTVLRSAKRTLFEAP